MSSSDLQDHTLVKVLFDFQYKTTEGREISIKKNEQLVLLQKTNADWWQVFRTTEQRSFYVPATYVRELSVQACKNTEEERDNASVDPSEGPKYKSMPKETTSAIKNVKKWLAGAMECTQDSSKSHEVYDDYKKYNAIDYQTRAELKIGLAAIKSKSLEREMRNLQLNSTDERRKSKELTKKNETIDNNLKTSSSIQPTKIDLPFQDGFRKELESSLDRRNQRKISGTTIDYDKIKNDNQDNDLKKKLLKTRVRTVSSRSDDSQIDSDPDDKLDPRINLSLNNELKDKLSPANSKRNSRSLDFEIKKIGQRTERSLSPKPIYGRQLTIAGCNINNNDVDIDHDDDEADSNDDNKIIGHKILNDKRSTWAVEELMSELTQMCKERSTTTIVNKKQNFHLKSTEIKSTFDPHDELTRELHEMNLQRSVTQKIDSSTSNVSKVSLNQSEKPQDKLRIETMVLHEVDEQQPETTTDKFTFSLKNNCELSGSQMKPLRSPKSPKILDEYNEANILNDSPTSPDDESLDETLSLSDNKKTKCPVSIKQELTVDKCHESPSYSNIKLKNSERVKLRPKIKIKNDDTQGELKLTPSLEKLASEIKFIPSNKKETIEVDKSKNIHRIGIKNNNIMNISLVEGDKKIIDKYDDSKTFDDSGIVDESLGTTDDEKIENNWLKFKNKLGYTGSFKTKREGKYFYKNKNKNNYNDYDDDDVDEEWKNGLKRTQTMHYTTVPESHRSRNDNFKLNKLSKFKRKSRSLSDLRSLEEIDNENIDDTLQEYDNKINKLRRPVPLPRTKLPGFEKKTNIQKDGYHTDEEIWITRDDIYPSKSSTAAGFKSLLSPSDSGSDNCLQSKELMESADELDIDCYKIDKLKYKKYNKQQLKESLSDELILSSNASSEALQSQSESEFTAGLDPSSSSPQQSPVDAQGGPDGFEYNIELPPGWTSKYDSQSEQMCFVNKQGDRWFSSHDAEGKIYFFKENSNESFWVLPTISQEHLPPAKPSLKSNRLSSSPKFIPPPSLNEVSITKKPTFTSSLSQPAPTSSNSSIPQYENVPPKKLQSSLTDWPQLSFDGNMKVLKEGQINRTKITENGKKLRKNWSTSHAVLTELFLLFFKDSKTFSTMMKSGQCPAAKPDISVDLNGARIELSDRASSRKNVYAISTVLGLQVLIQSDNTSYSAEWYQDIDAVIKKLPSQQIKSTADVVRKTSNSKLDKQSEPVTECDGKKGGKISRSKSMKMKRLDDSLEDLPNGSVAEKIKIKEKLKRFFLRRPSVESLVKVGIYKNEPAFGSSLQDVCPNTSPCVPAFVKKCIEVLESNEDNMKTDGLYRASGNLSQIQKIRLQVDQDKLNVLGLEEDVHVLTGALKLFFRELKEPLIPSYLFNDALNANNVTKQTTKIQRFRDIIKLLPQPNHDTLQFLLKHLLKVTSYQEYNRMHIPNLAIVFGPTLMWPAEESPDMALDLMQQNSFIDFLLTEYNKIFK